MFNVSAVEGLSIPIGQPCFQIETENIGIPEATQYNATTLSLQAYASGFIDGVSQTSISGWAYDSRYPDSSISVHIYIYQGDSSTHLRAVAVVANQYRADLEAAGYGNGYHGFSYTINWDDFPINSTYRIAVYGIDNTVNPPLQNSEWYFQPERYQWYLENGFWYLRKGNIYANGWQYTDGFWYYLTPVQRVEYTYQFYFPANAMMTNWIGTEDGTWFYLHKQQTNVNGIIYPQGAMARGATVVDGAEQYFDSSGYWQDWYLPLNVPNIEGEISQRWGIAYDHNGIDFGVPDGTPIYNSVSGIVTRRATGHPTMGNAVWITTDIMDPNGNYLIVRYLHMNSAPVVSLNQRVTKGQLLGYVGNTGQSFGAHLHFDVVKTGNGSGPDVADTYNPSIFFDEF